MVIHASKTAACAALLMASACAGPNPSSDAGPTDGGNNPVDAPIRADVAADASSVDTVTEDATDVATMDALGADIADVPTLDGADASIDASRDAGADAFARPNGIYVSVGLVGIPANLHDGGVPPGLFNDPNVEGVLITVPWSAIEPTMGAPLDLTFLNSQIDAALAAPVRPRHVTLAIKAGQFTPAWVFSAVAMPPLTFDDAPHDGTAGCRHFQYPIVWDSTYIGLYNSMTSRLASALRAVPARYNAITGVRLDGINEFTDEMRMPADSNIANPACMPSGMTTDAPALWLSRGYRPSLIRGAMVSLGAGTAAAFPDKALLLAIIQNVGRNVGFPPIDATGTIVTAPPSAVNAVSNGLTSDIIDDARNAYGSRFIAMWNALQDATPASSVILAAYTRGTRVAYQLDHVVYGDVMCGGDSGGTCDPAAFRGALDHGISNHAVFVEVFTADVFAYPAVIDSFVPWMPLP